MAQDVLDQAFGSSQIGVSETAFAPTSPHTTMMCVLRWTWAALTVAGAGAQGLRGTVAALNGSAPMSNGTAPTVNGTGTVRTPSEPMSMSSGAVPTYNETAPMPEATVSTLNVKLASSQQGTWCLNSVGYNPWNPYASCAEDVNWNMNNNDGSGPYWSWSAAACHVGRKFATGCSCLQSYCR